MRLTLSLLLMITVAACTQDLPNSRNTISQAALDAPYPELVPLEGLLAKAEAGSTVVAQTQSFERRVARLKQRAAALKGRSIVDGATRLRLLQAADRNAARQAG